MSQAMMRAAAETEMSLQGFPDIKTHRPAGRGVAAGRMHEDMEDLPSQYLHAFEFEVLECLARHPSCGWTGADNLVERLRNCVRFAA